MSVFNEITGDAFKDVSCTIQARVTTNAGAIVTPAIITSAKYTIYELSNPLDPDAWTEVTGHDDVSLTVADILYSSYQTWSVDATGYNFEFEIDASTNSPFPVAGKQYRIVVTLTPNTGQNFVVRTLVDIT